MNKETNLQGVANIFIKYVTCVTYVVDMFPVCFLMFNVFDLFVKIKAYFVKISP